MNQYNKNYNINDLLTKGKAHKLMACSTLNNLICLLTPFLISLWLKTKINVVFLSLGTLENAD